MYFDDLKILIDFFDSSEECKDTFLRYMSEKSIPLKKSANDKKKSDDKNKSENKTYIHVVIDINLDGKLIEKRLLGNEERVRIPFSLDSTSRSGTKSTDYPKPFFDILKYISYPSGKNKDGEFVLNGPYLKQLHEFTTSEFTTEDAIAWEKFILNNNVGEIVFDYVRTMFPKKKNESRDSLSKEVFVYFNVVGNDVPSYNSEKLCISWSKHHFKTLETSGEARYGFDALSGKMELMYSKGVRFHTTSKMMSANDKEVFFNGNMPDVSIGIVNNIKVEGALVVLSNRYGNVICGDGNSKVLCFDVDDGNHEDTASSNDDFMDFLTGHEMISDAEELVESMKTAKSADLSKRNHKIALIKWKALTTGQSVVEWSRIIEPETTLHALEKYKKHCNYESFISSKPNKVIVTPMLAAKTANTVFEKVKRNAYVVNDHTFGMANAILDSMMNNREIPHYILRSLDHVIEQSFRHVEGGSNDDLEKYYNMLGVNHALKKYNNSIKGTEMDKRSYKLGYAFELLACIESSYNYKAGNGRDSIAKTGVFKKYHNLLKLTPFTAISKAHDHLKKTVFCRNCGKAFEMCSEHLEFSELIGDMLNEYGDELDKPPTQDFLDGELKAYTNKMKKIKRLIEAKSANNTTANDNDSIQ